jgi:hypothetical protein
LLAWGTEDDVVDVNTQSIAFLRALKQAGFFVRTAVASAGDSLNYSVVPNSGHNMITKGSSQSICLFRSG